MEEIAKVVRQAGWRLMLINFFRWCVRMSIGVSIALCVALIVQRVFGLTWPWTIIFASAGGVVLLGSVVMVLVERKDSMGVARELDDRAGLRESLSTAMCVHTAQDPWSRVVVESARASAARVRVRDAVPLEAPGKWQLALGSAGALALAWFVVPPMDVFGTLAKKQEVEKQQQELVAAKADIAEKEKKLEAILEKAKVEFKDEKTDEAGEAALKSQELKNPDEVRRAAVKRLSDMSDKLQKATDSEKSQQLEALKDQLKQLKQSPEGPLNEFQRQLARGNFEQAKKELEEMAAKMADGQMSEDEGKKAQKQMEELSKQLEKIAEEKKELLQKMQEQGMTKEQAQELMKKAASGDPKELQKAMEQLKQLTPEQREQMMKQAMAQMKASQQMQKMAEACKNMSENAGKPGQMGQQGSEGMQGMMSELSSAEQMDSEMKAAEAAMNEIKSQMQALGQCMNPGDGDGQSMAAGQSPWTQGDSNRRGPGSGSAGKGNGQGPEEAPTAYQVKKEKANVTTGQGPIIGSRLVWGEQIRGESRAAFEEAVQAADQAAAEAIESKQVPNQFKEAVKQYFGSLKDDQAAKSGEKKAAAPAKDAEKK
ncbi:MAG TPA: hypothetical protein VK176_14890 [Phycisphaerales bacterium]|nr:hypothetical protein [Phycisphaerales bacterium]